MIFICLAYEQVQQHTAGFLGLQVALVLIAIQNTLFIIDTNTVYHPFGLKQTQKLAKIYLGTVFFMGFFKISATIYVVMNGVGAKWTLIPTPIPGFKVGRIVDVVWMLVNAILPLLIARFRASQEAQLLITIENEEPTYVDNGEEAIALTKTKGGASGGVKYEAIASSI